MAVAGRGKFVCTLLLCVVAFAAMARPAVAGRSVPSVVVRCLRRAAEPAHRQAGPGEYSKLPGPAQGVTGCRNATGLQRFVELLDALSERVENSTSKHLKLFQAHRATGSSKFRRLKSAPHLPSGPNFTHNR